MKRLTIKCGKEVKVGELTMRWVNDTRIAGADTRFSTHTLYHPNEVTAVAERLKDTNWHIIMPAEVKRLGGDKDVVAKFRAVAPKGTREWTINHYGGPWVLKTMCERQNYWCANGKGKAFTAYVGEGMSPSSSESSDTTALPIILVKNYPDYLDYKMSFGYTVWSSLNREHDLWDYAAKLKNKFNEWGKDKEISCTTHSDHDDSAVVSFYIYAKKSQYEAIEKFFEAQKDSAPYWIDYGISGVFARGV